MSRTEYLVLCVEITLLTKTLITVRSDVKVRADYSLWLNVFDVSFPHQAE